jgi:outer membrane protein assembly factor BamE
MNSILIKKILNKFFAYFLVLIIASCSSLTPYKVPVLQGNIFDEDDMSKLSEGLTKEQVQFIFGTALIKDPFHSNRWDYYYSIQVGDELLDEMKLSISFNSDDLLDNWTIEDLSE